MYDEAKDVEEHRVDVATAIQSMRSCGWDGAIRPAERILDIGGGLAMHAALLTPYATQTVCTDLRRYCAEYGGEFPRLLKEKFERHGHSIDLNRLELNHADAMELPYRDNWFEVVTSFNAFEHIPDPRRALGEMLRVVRPGGFVYITFDPIWTADSGSHFWPMVPEPWAHLVESDDVFRQRMRDGGATDGDLAEFMSAMNRRRLSFYDALFVDATILQGISVLHRNRWSGYSNAGHAHHENHERAIALGYSPAELATRGMRFVLRKDLA